MCRDADLSICSFVSVLRKFRIWTIMEYWVRGREGEATGLGGPEFESPPLCANSHLSWQALACLHLPVTQEVSPGLLAAGMASMAAQASA